MVVYRDDEYWVARCLQMAAVVRDKTKEAVQRDILGLILDRTRAALDNGSLGSLFSLAPAEEWKRLESATLCDVKRIDVSAGIAPDCEVRSPVREVEFCFV